MTKLLKWDLIDLFRSNPLVWAGMLFSLAAILIPTTGEGLINAILIVMSPIIGFISFCWLLLIAADYSIHWLYKPNYVLEFSTPRPVWQKLLSKLIWCALLNTLACLFLIQLFNLIGRFSGGSMRFIGIDQLHGIPGLVFLALVFDSTVMISFILAGSFSLTRRVKWLSGSLIFILCFGLLVGVLLAWMLAVGAVVLPSISTRDIVTIDGTFQIFSNTIPVVGGIAVLIIEFLAGSMLLAHRYQPD